MRRPKENSPRREFAQRFGKRLHRALKAQGIGEKRIIQFTGGSRSTLRQYLAGYNLPRMSTAERLASLLNVPELVEICRDGRTRLCDQCSKPYVDPEGSPSRYCSEHCAHIARVKYGETKTERRADAATAQKEVLRLRALLDQEATEFNAILAQHQAAAAAFCHDCEPEGVCHQKACSLRPVSPLPLHGLIELPLRATPAAGPYGSPENRAKTLAAAAAATAIRWARPGAREEQSARTARLHAEGRIPTRGNGKNARRAS